jgi:acetyl esterase/lipase
MRQYLDSVAIISPALAEVEITPVVQETFRGDWFIPENACPGATVLYLHGGGYSFYPKAYRSLIAMIAVAARARLFALDYRLTPEHRFPAQLEDALNAYRWLLQGGDVPENLVIAGDSAGGNLALTLLLAIRDWKLPQPALAIPLSPAIDLETGYLSMVAYRDIDWIDQHAVMKWSDWFCDSSQRHNPLVSPLAADLHGLPPIYIQAGRCEILYDSIEAFADRARSHGVDVILESWKDMTHVFQFFGADAPQSTAALQRIAEVIETRLRVSRGTEAFFAAGW